MRRSRRGRSRPAGSDSHLRAARSGLRCSRRPQSGPSGSPRSSRSATRPTSRRTTCSSGGRTIPATDLVLLYLESFGNPRTFARVARRVARRKPILALKAGSTSAGSRAASSHTAALASSDTAVDALFRQAGVLRARTLEELVDAAAVLSTQPLPRGRRIGVITNAGGLGILCADACESLGLELPELTEADPRGSRLRSFPAEASLSNPVDLLGSATAATYEAVVPHVLADPNVDALIVIFVPPVVAGADEVAAAIRQRRRVRRRGKARRCGRDQRGRDAGRALRARLGGRRAPLPRIGRPRARVRVRTGGLARAGLRPQLPSSTSTAAACPRSSPSALEESDDSWLPPHLIRTLLDAYGIPLVPERIAHDADEAESAARELGFPVVVKTAAAGRAQDRDRRRCPRPPRRRAGPRSSRRGSARR